MSIVICDRCGDVAVEPETCRCHTPYDPVAMRRRHRQAVARALDTARLVEAARAAAAGPRPPVRAA